MHRCPRAAVGSGVRCESSSTLPRSVSTKHAFRLVVDDHGVRLNETLVEERPEVAGLRSRAMPIAGTRAIRALGDRARARRGRCRWWREPRPQTLEVGSGLAPGLRVRGHALEEGWRSREADQESLRSSVSSPSATRAATRAEFRETFASWPDAQAYRLQQGTRPSYQEMKRPSASESPPFLPIATPVFLRPLGGSVRSPALEKMGPSAVDAAFPERRA